MIADGGGNQLHGGAGSDQLMAHGGNNTLLGGAGDDTLLAFGGNNTLDGGGGRDRYVFDAGFGVNHIADSGSGGNAVQFNFSFAGSGIVLGLGSLKLSFAPSTGSGQVRDELHIDNFNPDDPLNTCSTDTFAFADRTLSLQEMLDIGMDVAGTPDADSIQGTGMNERIYALAGDDTILAGGGNDVVTGGAGYYTSRISSFFPHAAANLRNVATEGDCLSLANEASKREIAGGFVPMRSAICAWVNPAASRAANSTSSKASSSRPMRATSLRNAASFIQPFTISSCDIVGAAGDFCLGDTAILRMTNLLFTSSGNLQFTLGRGLGFLDKAVQHHNSPFMRHAIKHAGNAAGILQPQLKQTAAHGAGMRHTKVRAELLHAFGISGVAHPHNPVPAAP